MAGSTKILPASSFSISALDLMPRHVLVLPLIDFVYHCAHSELVIDTRCLLQAQDVHNRTQSL
jgi:hypothetical protein